MQSTEPERRRWWQYAGPWPLYPTADAIVAALVALSARSFLMSAQSVPMEIFVATIFGLILFVILELARRYLPRAVSTFPGYFAAILVAVLVSATGLVMLPPTMVSLPLKLLVFVAADGWTLVVRSLLDGVRAATG